MIIGILKERFEDEQRVALSPYGVESLTSVGIQVVIEAGAGAGARFEDSQYEESGATIVYSPDEAAGRADIVLKVMPLLRNEFEFIREGQTLLSFMLLGMGKKPFIEYFMANNITAIGLELLKDSQGNFPILQLMSEISGQVSAQVAGRWLRSDSGGRGVLLGGLEGVAPAAVVILGAGTTGMAAANALLGLGAQIILLDNDLYKLRHAEQYFNKRITTVIASPENLRRGCKIADVLIAAISINEEQSHHIISEDMVKTMKPGAVILDISINQGGCVETSRPTTIRDPTFVKYDVIHYAVPNMPSVVARSSTYALTNGILNYLMELNKKGITQVVTKGECLSCGVVTYQGHPIHPLLMELYGIQIEDLSQFPIS
jgi:alanine dehydrogenase